MATPDTTHSGAELRRSGGARINSGDTSLARRLTTETKSFFKTSEFWVYLAAVAAVLIAGNSIESDGGNDFFAADKVWLYVTILTVGYMISRGFAKAGARDPYWEERGDRNADH
jgi:hypothetical protein